MDREPTNRTDLRRIGEILDQYADSRLDFVRLGDALLATASQAE